MMKFAASLLATCSLLSGCVAYETPYGDTGSRYSQYDSRQYDSRRYDRDRDGVPNRYDRDRDGDGVPNYRDARPDNPRRY